MEEAAIRNQDGSAALHGVSQQVVEAFQGHLFVEDGEQAAVQAQDNAGLGRGEEACQNTAHDNDDGQQRGHCINDDLDGGIGILDVRGLVAFLDRDEHSQTSDTQTHQDAGQIAAMNRAATETPPAVMEYRINGPDGGIRMPVGAEQILTAAE